MVSREIKRKYRVIDMMLTMHSVMRDRNHRRALFVDVINLAASVVLVAAVFADQEFLTVVGITAHITRYIIGISSLAVFFLSILTLRVNWKQQATGHHEAYQKLASLKVKHQYLMDQGENSNNDAAIDLSHDTSLAMSTLPPIADRQFNGLKAIHLRKIELSKALSHNPGASAILLRLQISLVASFRALRSEKVQPTE